MKGSFALDDTIEVLRRTPEILRTWLQGLSEDWTTADEGPATWSPYDVVGHLIHGERTDWIPRARHILEGRKDVPFEPFDRFAQFRDSAGKSLDQLLEEFQALRAANLEQLEAFDLGEPELEMKGLHPELGMVTLRQLLATWVTHDLTHVVQIARVMAKRHAGDVGPWREYLSVLNR